VSAKTPGQVAYEAWLPLAYDTCDGSPWDERDQRDRDAWEAAAQAAITAGAPAELRAAMAETRIVRERLDAIRKYCEAKIGMVGMVDGKRVARKVIAIIEHPDARLT